MPNQPDMSPAPAPAPDEFEQAQIDQELRIAAMTPAERFALMDRLCRELTGIAAHARPIG